MFNRKVRQKNKRNIRKRDDNSEEEDEPILTPTRNLKDGNTESQKTEFEVVFAFCCSSL